MRVLVGIMYLYGWMATMLAAGFVMQAPSFLTYAMLAVSVLAAPVGHLIIWKYAR